MVNNHAFRLIDCKHDTCLKELSKALSSTSNRKCCMWIVKKRPSNDKTNEQQLTDSSKKQNQQSNQLEINNFLDSFICYYCCCWLLLIAFVSYCMLLALYSIIVAALVCVNLLQPEELFLRQSSLSSSSLSFLIDCWLAFVLLQLNTNNIKKLLLPKH